MDKQGHWSAELARLEALIVDLGLQKTIKWGAPVFTHNGKNVVGIVGFKQHFALWFFQGAQMSDPLGKLHNAQEGRTQNQRQWRMTSWNEAEAVHVKAYVQEALEVAASAKPLPALAHTYLPGPLLTAALDQAPTLRAIFDALPPYQRKEFILHIESAKKVETQERRLKAVLEQLKKKG